MIEDEYTYTTCLPLQLNSNSSNMPATHYEEVSIDEEEHPDQDSDQDQQDQEFDEYTSIEQVFTVHKTEVSQDCLCDLEEFLALAIEAAVAQTACESDARLAQAELEAEERLIEAVRVERETTRGCESCGEESWDCLCDLESKDVTLIVDKY